MREFAELFTAVEPLGGRALQVRSEADRTLLSVDSDGIHMPDDLTLDEAKYVIRAMVEHFVKYA